LDKEPHRRLRREIVQRIYGLLARHGKVSAKQIGQLVNPAVRQAFSAEAIRSGWAACGLIPFDPDRVKRFLNVRAQESKQAAAERKLEQEEAHRIRIEDRKQLDGKAAAEPASVDAVLRVPDPPAPRSGGSRRPPELQTGLDVTSDEGMAVLRRWEEEKQERRGKRSGGQSGDDPMDTEPDEDVGSAGSGRERKDAKRGAREEEEEEEETDSEAEEELVELKLESDTEGDGGEAADTKEGRDSGACLETCKGCNNKLDLDSAVQCQECGDPLHRSCAGGRRAGARGDNKLMCRDCRRETSSRSSSRKST
jgi:hypothetical protein